MAFSTSYPSIPSEKEMSLLEISPQKSCQSGKKWASVPTLTSSSQVYVQDIDLGQDDDDDDDDDEDLLVTPSVIAGRSYDISPAPERQQHYYFLDPQNKEEFYLHAEKKIINSEKSITTTSAAGAHMIQGIIQERAGSYSSSSSSAGNIITQDNIIVQSKGNCSSSSTKSIISDSSSTALGAPPPGKELPSKCDLLSQLKDSDVIITTAAAISDKSRDAELLSRSTDKIEPDMMSSYDDNGNPLDLLEEGEEEEQRNKGSTPHNSIDENVDKRLLLMSSQRKLSNNEQQQQQQLVSSLVVKSTDSDTMSGSNNKISTSDEGLILGDHSNNLENNPIRLGFKSTLQKSVEGFMEEPKYFINAAALSEDLDTFTMPSLESVGGFDSNNEDSDNKNEGSLTNNCQRAGGGGGGGGTQEDPGSVLLTNATNAVGTTASNDLSRDLPTIMVKPRVPMSKSFPDIIQTTFVDDRCTEFSSNNNKNSSNNKLMKAETFIQKEPSFNDLAADSLEELPTTKMIEQLSNNKRETMSNNIQFDFKIETKLNDIMEMSQSQSQIGILAEKPPEAWVIDFNSLSLDSEAFENSDMSGSMSKSSNPTSLAYFIDIDDKSNAGSSTSTTETEKSVKSPEKKKIFSMFVDFGSNAELLEKQQQQQQQQQQHISQQQQIQAAHFSSIPQHHPAPHSAMKPSRLPVHRNVMNVLKEGEPSSMHTSMSSSSSSQSQSQYQVLGTVNGSKAMSPSATHSGQVKKRTFQYPSPILHHKANEPGTRISNLPPSVEPHLDLDSKVTSKDIPARRDEQLVMNVVTANNTMEMSSTSNRSSLHVATDFDMSFSSSFISSMETSGLTAEEVCSKGPCFKLGKDLLRMFLDGISTDVNICVNGRFLKAHKCILSSRSQYFAALFSGQLLEKAGNTITLDGFSYNVVHFAMCHIYSGTNEIPDSIDLLELATLTDLLGLEGLRENISQTIRVKFCHNFHRPCTGCISGVLECFPIAISFEMDELHRKMTKWICKHFVRIWPTKAFASLGDELVDKCLRYSVNHLSVDNILDITLGCDQLLTTMPSVRWTEPIFAVVAQMSKSCVVFIGENFSQVLQSQRFLLFGKGQQWNISRIEGTFVESLLLMKPDEACLSHTALSRLIELGTETIDEVEWSTMFVDFLKMLAKEVERYLIGNASKAVLSKYWEHLGQDVRKRICTSSFLGYDKAGNKIVKGNAATTGVGATNKQSGSGRLTHSERSASISSIKSGSGNKSTRQHQQQQQQQHQQQAEQNKTSSSNFNQANYSSNNISTAKIASVRPIQNVFSTAQQAEANAAAAVAGALQQQQQQQQQKYPNSNSSSNSHSTASRTSHSTKGHTTQLSRRKTEDREKSFSNSPRNSVASSSMASANRTPLNPLTPITPSKPGPGIIGVASVAPTVTATTGSRGTRGRNTTTSSSAGSTAAAANASKNTYITNSARANAVSKPNLRQKNVSSTSTRSTTPRTPNLSQPSRYASSLGVSSGAHTTATTTTTTAPNSNRRSRGSISSGSERPEKFPSTVTTPSSDPKGRPTRGVVGIGTGGGGSAFVASVSSRERRDKSTNKNHPPSTQAGGSTHNSSSSSSRKTSAKSGSRTSTTTTTANSTTIDPMRESVMSKSTIENDSGEPKIRTLAEIGRSSTFSKDEPTILGKLDQTQTLNIDFS